MQHSSSRFRSPSPRPPRAALLGGIVAATLAGACVEAPPDLAPVEAALHGLPGGPFHVIDHGHIDVVDAGYEDGALAISIHDESVEPGVERDPASTVMLVKPAARLAIPDARFAFLGPIGSDVWILPEGQLDAEAAGLLWPGVATEEIEPGAFTGDQLQLRFKQVHGPGGFSLFESPPDEQTAPVVLADSEDGLPDVVTLSAGTHRHANWAFEAPGLYIIRVDVRGRRAGVPGAPWVTSPVAALKFVVLGGAP